MKKEIYHHLFPVKLKGYGISVTHSAFLRSDVQHILKHSCYCYFSHHHTSCTARTSLDLELDLRAQHTRLQALQDELARLRELKSRLETARAQGDQELAAWVLEDQQFQNLVAQVSVH